MKAPSNEYDVIITGGGPAGSTLAALLTRNTPLRVALLDKEVFPREHIGESFAHPLIPMLEESGALSKVLASQCWIKKYGGIFNWDDTGPSITFFDHPAWAADGVHRWAMHVNRAEFDHILLRHAQDCGAKVFEATTVEQFQADSAGCLVRLDNGSTLQGQIFVDASGRQNSLATGKRRAWLSSYRNIAIWNHYLGGKPAQSLPGDWNIFREKNLSPIGCFAFRDGWCWYIPIPRIIDGERRMTHSIGIVTSPAILKEPDRDFTDPKVFMSQIHQIPLLRDLTADVRPVSREMSTATNYSMINENFCNYDGRWMLVGDASYFVDPLFSSGVAFASAQAAAAALAIRARLDGDLDEQHKRDVWNDYDVEWHGMAETFALSIDQWYHAIAKSHPDSVYWKTRGASVDLNIREKTFQALLNTAFTPDLLQILTHGSLEMSDLDPDGPFVKAQRIAGTWKVEDGAIIALDPRVDVRATVGADIPGFKAVMPPPPFELPPEAKTAIGHYWEDPVGRGQTIPSPLGKPIPCHRFFFRGAKSEGELRSINERDGGVDLYRILKQGPLPYGELKSKASDLQLRFLNRMLRAQMVTANPPLQPTAPPTARQGAIP